MTLFQLKIYKIMQICIDNTQKGTIYEHFNY